MIEILEKIPADKSNFANILVFLSDGDDMDTPTIRNDALNKLFTNYKDKISSFITIG